MKKSVGYAIGGILAGLANGLFGAGGGMVLVPVFIRLLRMEEKKAFATSLAVILPISLVSAASYFLRGGVDIKIAFPFIVGGTVGGLLGGRLFKNVSPNFLRILLSLFILYGGVRSLFLI